MNNKLTVTFGAPLLGGSGAKSANSAQMIDITQMFKQKELNELFQINKAWDNIDEIGYKYAMTINSDWSRHRYTQTQEKSLLIKILKEWSSKIKNLLLVYEYGKNGKMHFHMVINTKYIRELEKNILEVFGNVQTQKKLSNRCTRIKTIKPNKNEDVMDNMRKCINYLKKENHNAENCWISK